MGSKAKAKRPPTLNEVAELAGVSRATASRALAGYGRISEETVRKVKDSAKRLGYRPNEVARAMRAGKTQTIGLVVISDFTNAFFDRATKAIIDAAKAAGYQTLVAHTDERVENEIQAVRTLVEKRVDGLIVVPSTDSNFEHLKPKEVGNTPVVLIDRKLEGAGLSSVTTGDFRGARDAVDYAFKLGHRDMAFVIAVPGLAKSTRRTPVIPISTVVERTNGFLAGIKKNNLQKRILFSVENQTEAESAIEELIDEGPTIIFTSNNDMLLAVLRVAGRLGIQIGHHLSVISFDDSPWAAAMSPSITVVARPVDELGYLAIETLLGKINGLADSPSDIQLSTQLIERESVRKLKA